MKNKKSTIITNTPTRALFTYSLLSCGMAYTTLMTITWLTAYLTLGFGVMLIFPIIPIFILLCLTPKFIPKSSPAAKTYKKSRLIGSLGGIVFSLLINIAIFSLPLGELITTSVMPDYFTGWLPASTIFCIISSILYIVFRLRLYSLTKNFPY